MSGNDRLVTSIFMNLASITERADEQLLPSVYRNVGETFNVTPDILGTLTLCRAVMQALSSPLGGLLGHYNDRIKVVSAGCFIWGLMTLGFSTSISVGWGMLFWAVNGIGLAMVIPNYQSVTADYYEENQRGKAFGVLFMTSYGGGMLGGLFGTNVAHQDVAGISGWRVAFFCVGIFSILVSALNLYFAKDPRLSSKSKTTKKKVTAKKMWQDVKSVLTIPTFIIIIAQGISGSFPWNALVYLTLYLQLIGMSDFTASFLTAWFLGWSAIGGLLGGFLGDFAAKKFPKTGRIIVCQFSELMTLPFSAILMNLPTNNNTSTKFLYGLILCLMGLLINWPAPACNNPIFAEIVPEDRRNIVYSFDRCFELSIASLAAPIVGILAHRVFDFRGSVKLHPEDTELDQHNAHALGKAIMYCMIIPWGICLVLYSGLYWTYPKDKERSQKINELAQVEMAELFENMENSASIYF